MFACAGCGEQLPVSVFPGQHYVCRRIQQGFRCGETVTFDETDWRNAAPDDTDYWQDATWLPKRG